LRFLKSQIAKAQTAIESAGDFAVPEAEELDAFAEKATIALQNLNFDAKKAIVLNVVDHIVGTQNKLQVYGYLPITSHVEVCSSNRHGVDAARHANMAKIPFEFAIKLPPPLRTGVDYGFLPGTNLSRNGSGLSRGGWLVSIWHDEWCKFDRKQLVEHRGQALGRVSARMMSRLEMQAHSGGIVDSFH